MFAARRLTSLIRLSRLTGALGAISSLWFVVLWSWAVEQEPWDQTDRLLVRLGGAGVVGGGLYAYAAAMNDLFDLRRDRALQRERPLASGELSPETAGLYLVITLLAALSGAVVLGEKSTVLTLVVAGGIALYNAAAKLIPGAGLLLLCSLYAAAMFIPNTHLRFLWPVWLTMTHWLAVAGAAAIVSRRQPRPSPRAIAFAVSGWAGASAIVLSLGIERAGSVWPVWVSVWSGVLALGVGLALVARLVLRRGGDRARSAEKILRYGALWNGFYGTAWLLGQQQMRAAMILGALAVGTLVLSVAWRELQAMADQPITYTR